MIVATRLSSPKSRQFIAWNRPHEGPHPVSSAIARMATEEGDGMIVALVCWLFAFCATVFLGLLDLAAESLIPSNRLRGDISLCHPAYH